MGMSALVSFGITDPGLKRTNNEDSIYTNNSEGLFVLSDGMGGHLGGEVASKITVDVVSESLLDRSFSGNVSEEDKKHLEGETGDRRNIRAAIILADRKIKLDSANNSDLSGMGSTIDALVIKNGNAYIGHVGDSRVYRLRDNKLEQATEDHSVYNELIKKYGISSADAISSGYSHRVTNALGYLNESALDVLEAKVEKGDLFLLCSDGLTDVADNDTIEDILIRYDGDPETTALELVNTAKEGGGPDNISVILVSVQG